MTILKKLQNFDSPLKLADLKKFSPVGSFYTGQPFVCCRVCSGSRELRLLRDDKLRPVTVCGDCFEKFKAMNLNRLVSERLRGDF